MSFREQMQLFQMEASELASQEVNWFLIEVPIAHANIQYTSCCIIAKLNYGVNRKKIVVKTNAFS